MLSHPWMNDFMRNLCLGFVHTHEILLKVKEYQGSEKILTFLLEKRPLFQRSNGRGPSRELHKRESSLLVLLDPAHQHHIHEKPVGLHADNDDNPFKINIDVLAATFHSSSNQDRIFYPKRFRIGNSIRQGFSRKPRRIGFFIQNCFG